jgi:hypothetical protein
MQRNVCGPYNGRSPKSTRESKEDIHEGRTATGKKLAEAAVLFVEAIHQAFPAVATRPIPPYDDEDFTLEVRIPVEMDRDEVMNACMQQALEIEEPFGFVILPRVKAA